MDDDLVKHAAASVKWGAYNVRSELGTELAESVYEEALTHELEQRGMQVQRDVSVPIAYRKKRLDAGYNIDILVEDAVVVDVLSKSSIDETDVKRLETCLKLTKKTAGVLINFGDRDADRSIIQIQNDSPIN